MQQQSRHRIALCFIATAASAVNYSMLHPVAYRGSEWPGVTLQTYTTQPFLQDLPDQVEHQEV